MKQLTLREKVGYAMGDAGANLVFQMMMVYQLKFYTDIFGLEGAVAGTVLVAAPFIAMFADSEGNRIGLHSPGRGAQG